MRRNDLPDAEVLDDPIHKMIVELRTRHMTWEDIGNEVGLSAKTCTSRHRRYMEALALDTPELLLRRLEASAELDFIAREAREDYERTAELFADDMVQGLPIRMEQRKEMLKILESRMELWGIRVRNGDQASEVDSWDEMYAEVERALQQS